MTPLDDETSLEESTAPHYANIITPLRKTLIDMPLDLRLLKYFPDFLVNSFGENNQGGTMMCRCNLSIFTNQETFQWPEVLAQSSVSRLGDAM